MSSSDEAVEEAIDEATRQLNFQVEMMLQNRSHAIEIIKIDLLILTAVVAVIQILKVPIALSIVAAGLPLVASIMFALFSYFRVNPTIGLNPKGVSRLSEEDEPFKEVLSLMHSRTLKDNREKSNKTHRLMFLSLSLTVASLGAISGVVLFF